jgi:hypothetical protein
MLPVVTAVEQPAKAKASPLSKIVTLRKGK